MPLRVSVQLNPTVTFELFQPAAFGDGVAAAEIAGDVRSRFTETEVLAVFPALSVAVPLTAWLAPSVETVTGEGQTATPLTESAQLNVTTTAALSQPFAFGAGARLPDRVGGLLSRLTLTDAVAVFPALSRAVPEITWFAPSVVTWTGAGQTSTPLPPSTQENVTVISVLFQPAASGTGVAVAVILGGVLSLLTVTEMLALLPALSVAVPEMTWPAPSVVT